MKKHNLTIFFGILFGIAMLPIAYLSIFLGIVLSFSGEEFFAYLPYILSVMSFVVIVASCFARKNIWISRVVLLFSTLVLISVMIYLVSKEIVAQSVMIFVIYLVVVLLGIVAATFSYLAKPKEQKQI